MDGHGWVILENEMSGDQQWVMKDMSMKFERIWMKDSGDMDA